MNALRNDYDSLGKQLGSTAPVSVYNRSVEEMQSISVVPTGYLWHDSLLRMLSGEKSIIQSSAAIAREEVERVDGIRRAEGLCKLLKEWREEDDEEETEEILEFSRLDLGDGGFC